MEKYLLPPCKWTLIEDCANLKNDVGWNIVFQHSDT